MNPKQTVGLIHANGGTNKPVYLESCEKVNPT